ncbi:hypothetical protein K439DRAFT_313121 [Ramaria rubella]|nr:hypothetical protein K439DRAFT_313121 [Ramaria rubella]
MAQIPAQASTPGATGKFWSNRLKSFCGFSTARSTSLSMSNSSAIILCHSCQSIANILVSRCKLTAHCLSRHCLATTLRVPTDHTNRFRTDG